MKWVIVGGVVLVALLGGAYVYSQYVKPKNKAGSLQKTIAMEGAGEISVIRATLADRSVPEDIKLAPWV